MFLDDTSLKNLPKAKSVAISSNMSSSGRTSKLLDAVPEKSTLKQRVLCENEKNKISSSLEAARSLLREDLEDSSDEEERRNPMEEKYNSYGKEIKRRIAHKSSEDENFYIKHRAELSNANSLSSKCKGPNPLSAATNNNQMNNEKMFVENHSGIKI